MHIIHLITLLAVIQFLFFGVMVGRARAKYGVKAPATSGHEQFDRAFRVQMNSLETLIYFLPSFYIAAYYWQSGWPHGLVAGLGIAYLIGRFVYRSSYLNNPSSRSTGFLLTVIPVFVLMALGIAGIMIAWLPAHT